MTSSHLSRRARKAATREALRGAALECFSRHGFAEAPIAAITKAAGVAHGTFYVHFPSKEALLGELLEEFNQRLARALEPVLREAQGWGLGALVRRTAEVFLDTWAEHRSFVEAYARRIASGLSLLDLRDGINPPVGELITAWLRAQTEGQAEGGVRVALVAQGLLAMWFRIGLQYLFNEDVGREQAVATLRSMTLGAIEAAFPSLGGAP